MWNSRKCKEIVGFPVWQCPWYISSGNCCNPAHRLKIKYTIWSWLEIMDLLLMRTVQGPSLPVARRCASSHRSACTQTTVLPPSLRSTALRVWPEDDDSHQEEHSLSGAEKKQDELYLLSTYSELGEPSLPHPCTHECLTAALMWAGLGVNLPEDVTFQEWEQLAR